ncbi:MAG: AAA family ATPase [Treponema sp.]|nr:AAA family ATPase [Treponema sp.]
MLGNALTTVNNCSENDVLALAFYIYQMSNDVNDFESHEEVQDLYNALVSKLGLQKHADSVLNALINKLIQLKKLTPLEENEYYHNPFSFRGKLKVNFREDDSIYENCGNWRTNNVRNINLVRVMFNSGKSGNFSKIVALTFFTKPGSFEGDKVVIPNSVLVPAKIKQAVNDMSNVQFAIDNLKLSRDEAKVLQTAFRLQSVKEMYSVCNDFFRNADISRFEMYSKCLCKSQKDIRMLLKDDQKLKAYGLLDSDGDMDSDALDAIFEGNLDLYFTDIIKKEKSVKAYEPETFSVKKENSDLAIQLLKSKNPCNILLLGVPGAGKTEYAKALIKKAGLKMVSYKNELEVSGKDNAEARALNRLNCYLSLKKEDSILVVDEAETILRTREFSFFGMSLSSSLKGTVNNMLSNSENKVIWIVNDISGMDQSTLRRFTYSIKFLQMPKATLRSIASEKLKSVKMPALLKEKILDLCGKYKVTGASVENIVKAIKSLEYKKGNEEQVLSDVKSVLEANSTLLYGKKKIRDSVKQSYDLSVLNTSQKGEEIVEMLKNAEVYKLENGGNEEGVRCLFHGISGSGKTELARYISETLEKPLLIKRCSDLISPYVGQTEQNIAEAFEEAEATNSILLFDEADSFFTDRNMSRYGFERNMTNEFLTQMEEAQGIVICTTNHRRIIDSAMQRRFHIITEFKALDKYGIQTLLDKFFGKYEFTENQIKKLVSCDSVTPGDFGSLSGKLRFVSKEKLNSEFIINELLKIQDEKRMNYGGQIGFAS